MEIKQIKELMAAMGRTCTKRLVIKKEGFELELEREESGICNVSESALSIPEDFSTRAEFGGRRAAAELPRVNEIPPSLTTPVAPVPAVAKEVDSSNYVTSPMVGTYYAAPSPDDPPFIKVGDRIEKNTVVCIVEAMKVMNEVKAGVSGTVQEVLIESGHPVEFGTKLFRVTP